MSCWRNYTCDVLLNVDKEIMLQALKEKNITIDESIKHIHSRWNEGDTNVDAGFALKGQPIDLGIVFCDETGHVQINGDFWGTGIDNSTFVGELSQIYAKINRIAQLELQGWTVDTVEANAKGEVEIEAYMYA